MKIEDVRKYVPMWLSSSLSLEVKDLTDEELIELSETLSFSVWMLRCNYKQCVTDMKSEIKRILKM